MRGLRVKGMAGAAAVARRFALDRELVDELLLDYEAFGWISRVHFADVDGWSLTASGWPRTNDGSRPSWLTGARPKVLAAHEVFVARNSRFLVAITNWQIRPRGGDQLAANDHTDWSWDERVLDELHDLQGRLQPVCAGLAAALARFAGYTERYSAALDRVDRSERSWVAQPKIDSCHTVWMELHEDLLSTLGLERGSYRGPCVGGLTCSGLHISRCQSWTGALLRPRRYPRESNRTGRR
jgi:hypothetical protein